MSEAIAEAVLPSGLTPTRVWAIGEAMRIVRAHVSVPATLILFGSSVTGRAHNGSDLDIAIDASEGVELGTISMINEALENSLIPYYVDVVDLATADEAFVARVHRDGILWPS